MPRVPRLHRRYHEELEQLAQRRGSDCAHQAPPGTPLVYVCLAQGSLVLTHDGHKPIENVERGDLVLTHRGRWRPVLDNRCNGVRPTVEIRAQGVPGLRLTADHEVWARRLLPARTQVERRTARQLRMGEPAWVAAGALTGHYVNLPLPPVDTLDLDAPALWLIGRWLGDGYLNKANGQLWITCGHHERDELVEALGGRAGTATAYRTAVHLYVREDIRVRRVIERCGSGAAGKRIPGELLSLDPPRARALLQGYLSADGHHARQTRSPHCRAWQATSVSRALSLGMAMVAQRAHGVACSVSKGASAGETTIEDRRVQTRASWILGIPTRNRRAMVLEDGAWKRISQITPDSPIEVWDLSVAEDESFTAEGAVVHNCPKCGCTVHPILEHADE